METRYCTICTPRYRKFSPLFIGNPYISWGKQWFPVKMFPSTNQVVNLFGHINCWRQMEGERRWGDGDGYKAGSPHKDEWTKNWVDTGVLLVSRSSTRAVSQPGKHIIQLSCVRSLCPLPCWSWGVSLGKAKHHVPLVASQSSTTLGSSLLSWLSSICVTRWILSSKLT